MTAGLPQLAVDWGPVSAWVAAGATLGAVLVALFGPWLWRRLRHPSLEITFEPGEPCCRGTVWSNGKRDYWIRVRVRNVGQDVARACVGKVTRVNTGTEFRSDIDPMQLRWCGVPDRHGFDPIHLAENQDEFLNVFCIVEGDPIIGFETYPSEDFSPGHPTHLDSGAEHQVQISVVADNADPIAVWLTVKYTGDFVDLPSSLTMSVTA